MSTISKNNIVWIDCEMTGLNAFQPNVTDSDEQKSQFQPDRIIEIAVIVTNKDLEVLDEGVEFIISTPKAVLDRMDEWNTTHHGNSGLTASCLKSTTTMEQVDKLVSNYVSSHFPPNFSLALLAGNSVHADKAFISKDLPILNSVLHYRILDVSSIKELASRMYPQLARPSKSLSAHRALSDIHDSINELKYYRKHIFKSTADVESTIYK